MVENPSRPTVLASIYLSPHRFSTIVHVVKGLDHMLCKPNIPLGKFVLRPDADTITCPNCLRKVQDGIG